MGGHPQKQQNLSPFSSGPYRLLRLLQQISCDVKEERKCVPAALEKAEETGAPAVAIELSDGRIITGKTSALLGASSAALLNALKAIAGIKETTSGTFFWEGRDLAEDGDFEPYEIGYVPQFSIAYELHFVSYSPYSVFCA